MVTAQRNGIGLARLSIYNFVRSAIVECNWGSCTTKRLHTERDSQLVKYEADAVKRRELFVLESGLHLEPGDVLHLPPFACVEHDCCSVVVLLFSATPLRSVVSLQDASKCSGMEKVLFVEVGFGNDQHGQDPTKACVRYTWHLLSNAFLPPSLPICLAFPTPPLPFFRLSALFASPPSPPSPSGFQGRL